MKTSTAILWIVIAVVVIVGGVWWFMQTQNAAPQAQPQTTTQESAASSTAAAGEVPGANLTLGQDSNSSVGSFLVAYNGMTLYTFTRDSDGVSNCSGQCATAWPPYTVTTKTLMAESPVNGRIGTITRADGSTQVTYNGKPLYFYQQDKTPGDTMGQGVGGVWYVAKP